MYSSSSTSVEERVASEGSDVPVESITGFVTCRIEDKWWLACVLRLTSNDTKVKLTVMHPFGPASSFRYPVKEDIVEISTGDILTVVQPRTRTGRVYTLTKKELKTY